MAFQDMLHDSHSQKGGRTRAASFLLHDGPSATRLPLLSCVHLVTSFVAHPFVSYSSSSVLTLSKACLIRFLQAASWPTCSKPGAGQGQARGQARGRLGPGLPRRVPVSTPMGAKWLGLKVDTAKHSFTGQTLCLALLTSHQGQAILA